MVELEKWVRGIRDIHFSFHEHLGNYHVPGRALAECTKMKIRTGSLQGSYRPVERRANSYMKSGERQPERCEQDSKREQMKAACVCLGVPRKAWVTACFSPGHGRHLLPDPIASHLHRSSCLGASSGLPFAAFAFSSTLQPERFSKRQTYPIASFPRLQGLQLLSVTTYPQPGFSGGTGLGFYL